MNTNARGANGDRHVYGVVLFADALEAHQRGGAGLGAQGRSPARRRPHTWRMSTARSCSTSTTPGRDIQTPQLSRTGSTLSSTPVPQPSYRGLSERVSDQVVAGACFVLSRPCPRKSA